MSTIPKPPLVIDYPDLILCTGAILKYSQDDLVCGTKSIQHAMELIEFALVVIY